MPLDFSPDRHAVVHMREDHSPERDCEIAVNAAYEKAHQVFNKPPQGASHSSTSPVHSAYIFLAVIFCVFKVANDSRYNIFKATGEHDASDSR